MFVSVVVVVVVCIILFGVEGEYGISLNFNFVCIRSGLVLRLEFWNISEYFLF